MWEKCGVNQTSMCQTGSGWQEAWLKSLQVHWATIIRNTLRREAQVINAEYPDTTVLQETDWEIVTVIKVPSGSYIRMSVIPVNIVTVRFNEEQMMVEDLVGPTNWEEVSEFNICGGSSLFIRTSVRSHLETRWTFWKCRGETELLVVILMRKRCDVTRWLIKG